MTKLAPEWVRTSDPVIRSPARYRWTTAPAMIVGWNQLTTTGGKRHNHPILAGNRSLWQRWPYSTTSAQLFRCQTQMKDLITKANKDRQGMLDRLKLAEMKERSHQRNMCGKLPLRVCSKVFLFVVRYSIIGNDRVLGLFCAHCLG